MAYGWASLSIHLRAGDPVGHDDPLRKVRDDGSFPDPLPPCGRRRAGCDPGPVGGAAPSSQPIRRRPRDPGAAAAGWIAAQVEAGVGPGSLADAIFAYAATGSGADAAADALARLEGQVDGYILDGGDLLPGNLAKTMLAVQVAGGDPDSFGGHDLEADLREPLVTTPGPDLGRFGTAPNTDQALAILALARTSGGSRPRRWRGSWPRSARMATSSATAPVPAPGPRTPIRPRSRSRRCSPAARPGAAATSTQLLLDIQGSDGSFSSYGTPEHEQLRCRRSGPSRRGQGGAADDDAAVQRDAAVRLRRPGGRSGRRPVGDFERRFAHLLDPAGRPGSSARRRSTS